MSPEPDVVTVRVTSEIDAAEARQEARRLALRHAGTKPAEAQGLPDRVAEVGAPAFYYCKLLLGSLLPY